LRSQFSLERKGKIKDYHKLFGYAGVIWAFFNIVALLVIGSIENLYPAAVIMVLGIASTGIVYFISRQLNFTLLMDKGQYIYTFLLIFLMLRLHLLAWTG